jgi:uncharacterized membrane protein YeaQ/YmgE (transglycosylase-associated protein family)
MSDRDQGSRETLAPPADLSRTDPRIEDYLDHVFVPLVGCVPYATRATLRAELRAHLEALIDAAGEIGRQPDEAVRDALEQFGDPQALAGQVPSARPATFVALGCFGLVTSEAVALVVVASMLDEQRFSLLGPLWPLLLVLVVPLLAGLATGWLSPARQALGTFYALALLIVVTSLGGSILVNRWGFNVPPLGIAQGLFWLPIGCAAAALGGRLRALRDQAPKRWVLPT